MPSTTSPTQAKSSATTKQPEPDSTKNKQNTEPRLYPKQIRINSQSKAIADAITFGMNQASGAKDSIDLLIAKDNLFWDRVCILLVIGVLITWSVPMINTPYRGLWKVTDWLGRVVKEDFGDLNHALKKDDKVNGYIVTSPFGNRKAPVAGASTFHKGTDFGTQIGVQIYAPFNQANGESVIIQCRPQEDTGGGGLVAELIVTRADSVVFYQALHLSQCGKGKNTKTAIAKTGNSGIGTGAHLDLRKAVLPVGTTDFGQINRGELKFEPITYYEAWWFLAGSPPKPKQPKE